MNKKNPEYFSKYSRETKISKPFEPFQPIQKLTIVTDIFSRLCDLQFSQFLHLPNQIEVLKGDLAKKYLVVCKEIIFVFTLHFFILHTALHVLIFKVSVLQVKYVKHLLYLLVIEIYITTGIHTNIRITLDHYRMMDNVAPCLPAH